MLQIVYFLVLAIWRSLHFGLIYAIMLSKKYNIILNSKEVLFF